MTDAGKNTFSFWPGFVQCISLITSRLGMSRRIVVYKLLTAVTSRLATLTTANTKIT